MPIKVTCASCGATLTTPDSSAGKTGKCPKCKAPIQIPANDVEEEILDAEDSFFDGLDEESLTAGEVSQDQRKPCPACGELIVRDAIKCRYCGEIFDPLLKKQEQKKLKKATAGVDSDLSVGEWVVAILCSGIGCICGIVWMIQGKPKGKKMLMVSLAVQGFWVLIRLAAQVATQGQ